MPSAKPEHKSAVKTDPYFVGFWTDFMFVGGLSLILLPLLYPLSAQPYFATVLTVSFFAQMVVNFPHFSATLYRLYRRKSNMAAFPVTSYVIPFVIAAMTIMALQFPQYFAGVFIMIYLLWSPYHFSGQSSGVTMVYARRSGYRIGPRERLCLSGFIFSSFLINFIWLIQRGGQENVAVRTAGNQGLENAIGMAMYQIHLPDWTAYPVAIALVISAAGFFYLMARQSASFARRYPPIMLFLPAVAHFFWFTISARFGILAFIAFVPLFHSLQYLFIAWAVQMRERQAERQMHKMPVAARSDTFVWYILNVMGGLMLFLLLPDFLARVFDLNFWTCFFIVAVGIQIHHFFVDGVIWKLRDPDALSALTTRVRFK